MKITVKSEIDALSEVYRGHGVPADTLARWLGDVDSYIAREILHIEDGEFDYSYSDSPDTELLVAEPPYRRIYFLYLSAMVDFVTKQFNTYASEIGEYNSALADYRHYIVTKYNPAALSSDPGRTGYYISAYSIAKKHGFAGSEAEWLESLCPLGDIDRAIDEIVSLQQSLLGGDAV